MYKNNVTRGSAGFKMLIHGHFLGVFRIFSSEVGHNDTVFGLPSGFFNRFVCARLQVSVCSGDDMWHPGWPKIGFLHCDSCEFDK